MQIHNLHSITPRGGELVQFMSQESAKSPKEFILATCSLASLITSCWMTANLSISSDRSNTHIGLILHVVGISLFVDVISPGRVGGETAATLGGLDSSSITLMSSSMCSELTSAT